MAELFLEVRSQELSHRRLGPILKRLATRIFEELTSRGIELSEVVTGATPRRLALAVKGLPAKAPDGERTHLGPAFEAAFVAMDSDAVAGEDTQDAEQNAQASRQATTELLEFCRQLGVTPDQLTEVRTERGRHMAWLEPIEGAELRTLMAELVQRHLNELLSAKDRPFGSARWPRPVTGLTALLDGEVLELELDGKRSAAVTVGHPAGSLEPIAVDSWQSWSQAMAEEGIVPSLEGRRRQLQARLDSLAQELGGQAVSDAELIRRVTASCAIPTLIYGSVDPAALLLPRPLFVHTLAESLNAFAVESNDGLLPYFITVVDRPEDTGGVIRRGFERAVSGRLSDIQFAYDADRRVPLARRVRRLEQLTFHPGLGTWAEKSRRLQVLVEQICNELDWQDIMPAAAEAATLLKADLATLTVQELPRLRGILGGLYAREEGYGEDVWQAIQDQYMPTSPNAAIPRSRVGQVLAVADRLGTLVGFFGIGQTTPSRRRDPHGLRPMASQLLTLLLKAEMSLDLDLLAARAVRLYGEHLSQSPEVILKGLQELLHRRLDDWFGNQGFQRYEIDAAKAVGTRDLPDLHRRLDALRAVSREEGFRAALLAAQRIAKIVANAPEHELSVEWLQDEAEIELHRALEEASAEIQPAVRENRYEDALRRLVQLTPTLDRFLAEVLVMDEDERRRNNRIALLQSCRRLQGRVARLSAMEVERWAESVSSTTT